MNDYLNDQLECLYNTLTNLQHHYECLLKYAEEQRMALLKQDTSRLQTLVELCEVEIAGVQDAERRRMVATEHVIQLLGIDSGDIHGNVTAIKLAESLDAKNSQRLIQSVESLRSLIHDLVRRNETNRLLTEQSAGFHRYTLQAIAASLRAETYGPASRTKRTISTYDSQV